MRSRSCIWESPLTSRDISWDIRQLQLRGEPSNPPVAGRTEGHRWSVPQPQEPQPKTPVHQHTQGLGAGMCSLDSRPREELLLLAARRQPEWMEVRSSSTRNAHGGILAHQRSEAPSLTGTKHRAAVAASLLTCWPLPPRPQGRALTVGSLYASAITSFTHTHHTPATQYFYASTIPLGWSTCPDCHVRARRFQLLDQHLLA